MNKEQEQAFEKYEELKGIIREAEAEIKKLQPIILPLVPEDKEYQTEKGYFYIQPKTKWKFSPDLVKKEEELDEEKAREKAEGVAEATTTPVLYYRTGTPEENKKKVNKE